MSDAIAPAPAMRRCSAGVRLAAAGADAIAVAALAVLLAPSTGRYFAARAVPTLRIGEPGSDWVGAVPFLLGAVGPQAYGTPFAVLIVLLTEPLFATSPGKQLARARIQSAPGFGRRWLWVRFAVKTAPAWIACLALIAGSWPLAVTALVAAALALPAVTPVLWGGDPLHDRIARTRLLRRAR